jgi:hypothetical protein
MHLVRAMLCIFLLTVGGCGFGAGSHPAATPTSTANEVTARPSAPPHPTRTHKPTSPPASSGSSTPKSQRPPVVSKVLVFVVENHSLDQMRDGMPYTYSLAERYGYADSYRALTHPSLGNYLAIAGGSTFGVVDDRDPAAHPIEGPDVFSAALAAGKTAGLYAEGMPGTCWLENGGARYVVRHNPWTYFVDGRSGCERFDVPLSELSSDSAAGSLPNVGMVIPDLCNDAHDCGLATADEWLREHVRPILGGPDWRSGRLAVVITADEDDRNQGNLVLTAVIHPSLHHVVVDEALTHLSLSRLCSEASGLTPLRAAQTAPSLAQAFGLRIR